MLPGGDLRNVGHDGDFLEGEILRHTQMKHEPSQLGEIRQSSSNQLTLLLVFKAHLDGRFLARDFLSQRVNLEGASFAFDIEKRVGPDAQKPGAQVGTLLERVPPPERTQECLLRQILAVMRVSGQGI